MLLTETKYLGIKKLAFALLVSLRKLKLYFQEYMIVVLTSDPLKQVFHRLETLGILIRWSMELS